MELCLCGHAAERKCEHLYGAAVSHRQTDKQTGLICPFASNSPWSRKTNSANNSSPADPTLITEFLCITLGGTGRFHSEAQPASIMTSIGLVKKKKNVHCTQLFVHFMPEQYNVSTLERESILINISIHHKGKETPTHPPTHTLTGTDVCLQFSRKELRWKSLLPVKYTFHYTLGWRPTAAPSGTFLIATLSSHLR